MPLVQSHTLLPDLWAPVKSYDICAKDVWMYGNENINTKFPSLTLYVVLIQVHFKTPFQYHGRHIRNVESENLGEINSLAPNKPKICKYRYIHMSKVYHYQVTLELHSYKIFFHCFRKTGILNHFYINKTCMAKMQFGGRRHSVRQRLNISNSSDVFGWCSHHIIINKNNYH